MLVKLTFTKKKKVSFADISDDRDILLGPSGQSVPAQVKDAGGQTFKVEFCPRVVGEHKIAVNYKQVPVAGSPFSSKVYDVNAIKVKSVPRGTVGQPVTFLGELDLFCCCL